MPLALGTETEGIRFAWRVDLPTWGYEIEVEEAASGDIVWRQIASAERDVGAVMYSGPTLASFLRYRWRVRLLGRSGWSRWNQAEFVTGLSRGQEWPAAWVGAPGARGVPRLAAHFAIDETDRDVYLHFVAGGYAAPTVNGATPGNAVLLPPWTDYQPRDLTDLLYPYRGAPRHGLRAVVLDITALVHPGSNRCEIELAPGWFDQRIRSVEGDMFYGEPKLSAFISSRQSSREPVRLQCCRATDWTWSESEFDAATIFGGVRVKAHRSDSEHPAVAAAPIETPIRAALGPFDEPAFRGCSAERAHDDPLLWRLDSGRNSSGWIELKVDSSEPVTIDVTYAEERKPEGGLDYTSTGGNDQVQHDVYELPAGSSRIEPRHTWHGFRYADVRSTSPLVSLVARSVDVHPRFEVVGEFTCADGAVNKVHDLFKNSFLTNYHSGVPSDCPHRERLGYTGDAHVVARAAMWTFDLERPYREYIDTILDAQDRGSGFVPHTAPFAGGGGGPGWGSAIAILPWEHYLAYGDSQVLAASIDGIERWIAYLGTRPTDQRHPFIVDREEPGSWFLGDWAWPGCNQNQRGIEPSFVSTYFYAKSAAIASDACRVLGRHTDARRYAALFREIVSALDARFFDPARSTYVDGTGASAAFMVDLLDDKAPQLPSLLQSLVRRYERTRSLDTGIFGTPLLLEALSRAGRTDLALELLFAPDGPSFHAMLQAGATTLWENWDGSESHNHPMFGAVSAWFCERVAGVRCGRRQSRREGLVFEPFAQGALPQASLRHDGPRGRFEFTWDHDSLSTGHVRVRVPPGTEARLVEPSRRGSLRLPSGLHEFDWTAKRGFTGVG